MEAACVILVAGIVALLIGVFAGGLDALDCFVNPQYVALREILKAIK